MPFRYGIPNLNWLKSYDLTKSNVNNPEMMSVFKTA